MTGIVVAGMHRSGTSLLTHFLAAGGWHPGEVVLSNPSEAFAEDAEFVALHRTWIDRHLPPGAGHHDWGLSAGGSLDLASALTDPSSPERTEAQAFVDQRDRQRPRWVAKDPRASLVLPLWAEIPSLRFILVYRSPWDVVDSAVRLGAEIFCRYPRQALTAWLDHNRRIASFAAAHRERCIVIASEVLIGDHVRAWAALDRLVGLDGSAPEDLVDPTRYICRTEEHPIAALYREVHPEVCRVLDDLDGLADVPRTTSAATGDAGGAVRAVPGGTLPADTGLQVVIPCRDDGDFLLEAVASVDECARRSADGAGRPRVEVTIADDGSTDAETRRILRVLRATGRQVLVTPSLGLAGARNAALAASHTAAVIPLDADNRLRVTVLEALAAVESSATDIVHSSWERFGMERGIVEPPEMTLEALVPGNTIDACAVISRDLLTRLGGWDPALPFWEDWDLWLGAVETGATARRIDTVLFDYFVRPGSLGSRARRDPDARHAVVRHIVTKHASLLGPTLVRLVEMIHHQDSAQRAAEDALAELEQAYRALEGHALTVDAAFRQLEEAYRALEARYRSMTGET